MAVYDQGFAPQSDDSRSGNLVNYAGAALSLAMVAGVGLWGYQLIMRDVSGIPVVRAMEGEMRVLPDTPGGDLGLHTGFSVNEVAAMGEAGGPEDVLILAPGSAELAQEDLVLQSTAEEDEVQPAPNADAVNASLPAQVEEPDQPVLAQPDVDVDVDEGGNADILALADQITQGIAPFETPPAEQVEDGANVVATYKMRPVVRPAGLGTDVVASTVAASVASAAPAEAASEVAISTQVFPVGTSLVQLGAFRHPTEAVAEWGRLQARFGQLLAGKSRVIQVSNQSSGTWYRLRASGFADRPEARRFCTALEAEGASCIAVLVD